jgi:hypothetical protein
MIKSYPNWRSRQKRLDGIVIQGLLVRLQHFVVGLVVNDFNHELEMACIGRGKRSLNINIKIKPPNAYQGLPKSFPLGGKWQGTQEAAFQSDILHCHWRYA